MQLVFEVGDILFILVDKCGLVVNFLFRVVQILPIVLFLQRLIRVAVILLLLQVVFALQDVQFMRVVGQLLIRSVKEFAPVGCILDWALYGGWLSSYQAGFVRTLQVLGAGCCPTTLMVPVKVPRLSSSIVILDLGAVFFASRAFREASTTLSWP